MDANAYDLNYDAEEYLWGAAINDWLAGRPAALEAIIREKVSAPDFALDFLGDLVSGRISKGKGGRPAKRTPGEKRIMAADFYAARESAGADDVAYERVSELHGVEAGAVRRVVADAKKNGFTLDAWIRWGRPRFLD